MSEILAVSEGSIKIGNDDGSIINVPTATLQFANPKEGDQVRVYTEEGTTIVRRLTPASNDTTDSTDLRRINKVLYVLMSFFFGALGVHRFLRGQVGLGILMILFSWATLGIWPLVDFIIGLAKLSKYNGDDFIFTLSGKFTK